MSVLDLNALANSAGFGTAKKALVDAGLWREVDAESQMPIWRVDVEIEVTHYEDDVVFVAAATEADARKGAERFDGFDCEGDITVMSCKPAKPGDVADFTVKPEEAP